MPSEALWTCEATEKFAYRDRKTAKKVARRLGGGLRAYLCEACGMFHVGHLFGRPRHWHRQIHREAS